MMIIVVVLMVDDDDNDDDDDDHLVDADDVPRELRRWSLVRRIHWRSGNRRNLQSINHHRLGFLMWGLRNMMV